MKRRNRFSPFFACLVILGSASTATAQTITGAITGTVVDATGGALPGATISATCTGTGLARSAVSAATGAYSLPELPICVYRVSVSMAGFKTTTREVQVAVNNVTKADFKLAVGEMAEEVTVEGAAPLVEFSDKLNNYVDRARIDSLPLNGRDFNSLLGITPGVQRAPGGGFLAVNVSGQRRTANNYQLDGMPNNDRYYGDSLLNQTGVVGTPATLVPMDAIAEFTVQQTPSAEFGVKGGAAINVVLKSGTNDFHGSAHLYFADEFANAANYFNKATGPEGCTGSECGDRTAMSNKQFGGTLGGPLAKDKTFFFAFYEAQRLETQSPYSAFVPTPDQVAEARARIAGAGLQTNSAGEALLAFYPVDPSGQVTVRTPTVADSDTFSLKLDHRFDAKSQISARYVYGSAYQSNTAFVGTLSPPPPNPPDLFNSVLEPKTSAQLLGVNFTSSYSANKIFEARVNWTRFRNVLTPNNKIDPRDLGLDTGPLDPEDFGVPAIYYLSYFGYIGGVGGYPITTSPTDTLDVSAHHTLIKDQHTLKVGGNFQRATSFNLRNRARSVFYITGGTADPVDSLVGLLLGRFDSAARSFGSTRRTLEQNSFGIYATDDWKLSPRFTLNLGLRYDWSAPLGEKDNIGANFFPDRGLVTLGQGIDQLYASDKNNFGPRVGFAWDVTGNGRTALRGGYSLTYDIPNFGSIHAPRTAFLGARAGAFSQPNLGIFSVLLEGDLAVLPDDPSATCVDPTTGAGNYVCVGPGVPIYGTNPGGTPPFNAFSIDENLKTPTLHTFHATLQHEVFKNNVVTVSYVGSRGRNLLMYRDLNASPIGGGSRPFASQYPDLDKIIQLTNAAKSWYDSLQLSWRQSNWRGFNSQYNFTLGKCTDYASINRGSRTNFPQSNNPFRPEDNKGPCDHDIRYNLNVGGTYSVPSLGLGRLGEGWQVATVFTGLSGRRYTPHLGARDRSGQGGINAIRANCNAPIRYNPRDPSNYIANASEAFSIPPDGTIGTCGRNVIEGPGLAQWDVSLLKDTRINDRVKLQFRWEVFNVLNRANFDAAGTNFSIRSGAFGQLTATPDVASGNPVLAQGGPRAMQFVLKLLF
jgi:outer membrane receptor protein involved in Fe transport